MSDPADGQQAKRATKPRTTQEIAADVYKLIPLEQHEAAEKLLREMMYNAISGAWRFAYDNNPAVRG